MKRFGLNKISIRVLILALASLPLFFQNCQHPYDLKPTDPSQFDSQGRRLYKGQLTVGASKENPPVNLIFVVDNSASMLGHQIDLGAAFSKMFTNNIDGLANFDARLFLYSTASTTNSSTLGQVPTRNPAAISSVPAPSDTATLATVPGGIFGTWNNMTGTLGIVPYSAQLNPASVLDMDADVGSVTQFVSSTKKGSLSDTEYLNQINNLTTKFQRRLAYLDPTNQLSYGSTTDVSSGLCTVSRLMRHPEAYYRPGDSAAFIIVSDDNDRLNVRNPNNNQCIESVVGSSNVIDGHCGHYESDFGYNTTSVLSYQYESKLNYESGTKISYTYPSSENCNISYQNGFRYTSTYTAIKTLVTYDKCLVMSDGVCITVAKNSTATVSGDFTAAGGTCTSGVSSTVPSPAPGTAFACAHADVPLQTGPSGVDTVSDGSACSAGVLASLNIVNHKDIACAITGVSTTASTISGQPLGSCSSYCSTHPTIKSCTLTSTIPNNTVGNMNFNINGLTCSSTCPTGSSCGTGTIDAYLKSTYGPTTTCSRSANISTLTVNTAVNADGSKFGCASSLNPTLLVKLSGSIVCTGAADVASCISSLQTGTTAIGCSVQGYSSTTIAAPPAISCSTACSASSGFCNPATYPTVQNFISKAYNGYCTGASPGGSSSLTLKFVDSVAPTASCSSKCSDTKTGGCDAAGFGASDGATVNDYIQSQKGGVSCSVNNRKVNDSTKMTIDSTTVDTNPATVDSVCTIAASPFFFNTTGAYAAPAAVTYVAGDATHKASDLRSHIVNQSKLIFGTNNAPSMAVITQLAGDSLPGTDVGTEYINLASDMGSTQVSSIKGDYSVALSNISDFIVKSTKNSYVLPIDASQIMVSVSVIKVGSAVAVALDPSLWTWSGRTLSISDSAGLVIGDQIIYQYRAP